MASAGRPQFLLSRWLFLRLLGVVYLLAFASLTPQIAPLVGESGLMPLGRYLDAAHELWEAGAYYRLPTLAWISASDAFLYALCWGGMVLSALAIAGVAPMATFACLWVFYLSLTVAGQDFLSFQWDVLLLETGLLAYLYAPLGWWPRLATESAPLAPMRWLLWGLAFKLTLLSGITKLVSGDPTWWGFTALTFHYETQPIPTWTSWYVYNLPEWFNRISVGGMFFIELVVPFVILVPARFRSVRGLAVALMCALQIVIGATGNYGFFNLLTVVLYLALLDDVTIAALLPGRAKTATVAERDAEPRSWRLAVGGVAVVIGVLSAMTLVRETTTTRPQPAWSSWMLSWVAPTRSINGYGLFRTMTTERPEIVIEGSRDGTTWTEYVFRWKAGDVARRPRFVQPHMPRLDWQMWFAALDPQREAHWLIPLAQRLLDGSPTVLALLGENPFADEPPASVRLAMYRYHFTTGAEGADGAWWRREFLGYLTETISR